jgi:hypothetical protein
MVRKSALFSGAGGVVASNQIDFTNTALGAIGGRAIRPAFHFGSTPGNVAYFVSRVNGSQSNIIRIIAITNPLTSPTQSTYTLSIPSYGQSTPRADQPGLTFWLDTRCYEFMNVVWRNGSLYTAITGSAPSVARSVVHWQEIATNGFPSGAPSLVQAGSIDGGPDEFTFLPSINVDPQDNVVICYSQSSANTFAEMRCVGRRPTDPHGSMRDPRIIHASTIRYEDPGFGTTNLCRWGDYAAVAVDPTDGSFWICNEWVKTTLGWSTWWANIHLR